MTMSIVLLLLNLGVLSLVLYNARHWPRMRVSDAALPPCVSVLIPARNEEDNISRLLHSVLQQPGVAEILVYDDHSSDQTAQRVLEVARKDGRVRLLAPKPLRSDWFGKPFACRELAREATGRWLLFLDADALLMPNAVPAIVRAAEQYQATFLSCWPGLLLNSWAEKCFMPLLNFVVFSLFPAPLSLKMKLPSLGLAHGVCILAERAKYEQIGGHELVKTELFEDTALARAWRARGLWGICLDGQDVVKVRMYESLAMIWRGFEKIAYPAFRRNLSFWLFVAFHFWGFVWPFAGAVHAAFGGKFAVTQWGCVMAAIAARMIQAVRFGYPIAYVWIHPVAECALVAVLLSSALKCVGGRGVYWKGRRYHGRVSLRAT